MQQNRTPDKLPPGTFPCLGCLGAGTLLGAVGALVGFYLPFVGIPWLLAGLTVGGFVGARARPRPRNAFALSVTLMILTTTVIGLNHNGPDPRLYLTADAVAVLVGVGAAFIIRRPPWPGIRGPRTGGDPPDR